MVMSSARKKSNALHLPGKTFSPAEEEYIIDLKESQIPALDWTALTERFNLRFPLTPRTKGGLQVHYSRSLQPGSRRRPSSRPSRRPPIFTTSGGATEATATTFRDYHGTDSAGVGFHGPFASSNIQGDPILHPHSLATINPRAPSSRFFEEVASIFETGALRVKSRKTYADDDSQLENDTSDKESEFSEAFSTPREAETLNEAGSEKMVEDVGVRTQKIKLRLGTGDRFNSATFHQNQPENQPFIYGERNSLTAVNPHGKRPKRQVFRNSHEKRFDDDELKSPRRPEWVVCTRGLYAWEFQRFNSPHMPYSIKWPGPNRVIEYSAVSGSFRTRSRKDTDPPYPLTSGGEIYLPKRPVEVSPSSRSSKSSSPSSQNMAGAANGTRSYGLVPRLKSTSESFNYGASQRASEDRLD